MASTDILGKNMNQHSKNRVRRIKKEYTQYQDKTCTRKKILVLCMSGFFCVWLLRMFVSISLGILRKLPEDGMGSKLRKGHRDSIVSYEVKTRINFEGNNGKAFNHYKARDKNPEG